MSMGHLWSEQPRSWRGARAITNCLRIPSGSRCGNEAKRRSPHFGVRRRSATRMERGNSFKLAVMYCHNVLALKMIRGGDHYEGTGCPVGHHPFMLIIAQHWEWVGWASCASGDAEWKLEEHQRRREYAIIRCNIWWTEDVGSVWTIVRLVQ